MIDWMRVYFHCLGILLRTPAAAGRHRMMTHTWRIRGKGQRKDYCSCGFNA